MLITFSLKVYFGMNTFNNGCLSPHRQKKPENMWQNKYGRNETTRNMRTFRKCLLAVHKLYWKQPSIIIEKAPWIFAVRYSIKKIMLRLLELYYIYYSQCPIRESLDFEEFIDLRSLKFVISILSTWMLTMAFSPKYFLPIDGI